MPVCTFNFLSELKSWCTVWTTRILHKFSCFQTNTTFMPCNRVFQLGNNFLLFDLIHRSELSPVVWEKRQSRSRNICRSRWRWGGGSPCWPPGFLSGRGCTAQLYHHLAACMDGTLSNFNNGHLAIETV